MDICLDIIQTILDIVYTYINGSYCTLLWILLCILWIQFFQKRGYITSLMEHCGYKFKCFTLNFWTIIVPKWTSSTLDDPNLNYEMFNFWSGCIWLSVTFWVYLNWILPLILVINSYYLGSNNQNFKMTYFDIIFEIYFFISFFLTLLKSINIIRLLLMYQ